MRTLTRWFLPLKHLIHPILIPSLFLFYFTYTMIRTIEILGNSKPSYCGNGTFVDRRVVWTFYLLLKPTLNVKHCLFTSFITSFSRQVGKGGSTLTETYSSQVFRFQVRVLCFCIFDTFPSVLFQSTFNRRLNANVKILDLYTCQLLM